MLYDCFRLFRLAFPAGKRLVFWQDGLFFLLMAILLFRFTLRLCSGRLRLFVLLGSLLGFVLYYGTVGALAYRLCSWLAGGLRRFFRRTAGGIRAFGHRFIGHFMAKKKDNLGQNN